MSDGSRSSDRSIGLSRATVKIGAAALLVLVTLAIPGRQLPDRPRTWDVLVVLVSSVDFERRTLTGRQQLSFTLTDEDRAAVKREVAAFVRRVRIGTDGRLVVRVRSVTVPGPLTTLSGPGPHWLTPRDVAPLLRGRVETGAADTVMVFAKVGDRTGPAIPVSHLGAAYGADQGLDGACFAGITFRSGWIDGGGTTALHEWLHGLQWFLTAVAGFTDEEFPDPDRGREDPTCCPDTPAGDGPYAEHLLRHHLTPDMIRAVNSGLGTPQPPLQARPEVKSPDSRSPATMRP